MPANTPHRILELIAWLSGRGLSQRVISRITGVSQGGKSKVLSHVRETVRAIQSHMGIGWGWPHQGNTVPSSSRIRVKLIRRTGCYVSAHMVQRRLTAAGYRSRRPVRCPRLTLDHRPRPRIWAWRLWNWKHQHWSHVIFANESRFSLYHWDGRARIRRHVSERLVDCCIQEMDGNVSPSFMVWDAFHASDKSELKVMDTMVNQQRYIGILRQNLLPWARATFQRNFVHLHDNATPHTARNTCNFLAGEEVEVMAWPTQSPDLNPIEHIWDQMGLLIRNMDNPPTTVARLQGALLQAWGAVTPERVKVLVWSMPLRLRAVLAASGGDTRY